MPRLASSQTKIPRLVATTASFHCSKNRCVHKLSPFAEYHCRLSVQALEWV